jgi:hypothetical protein
MSRGKDFRPTRPPGERIRSGAAQDPVRCPRGRCLGGAKSDRPSRWSAGGASQAELFQCPGGCPLGRFPIGAEE